MFFFFKQKTAYEMRISDWSSDVCSSDLYHLRHRGTARPGGARGDACAVAARPRLAGDRCLPALRQPSPHHAAFPRHHRAGARPHRAHAGRHGGDPRLRSEEHTSELQSLMRISYAVFCLKKKTKYNNII